MRALLVGHIAATSFVISVTERKDAM